MSDAMPSRPNLEWLKNRAKERLAELRASDPAARLADAQREVARRYGFPSWRALKAHVDSANKPGEFTHRVVQAFFEGVGTGKLDAVREALDKVPGLANAVGPHPFWGGRPQALHVSIESDRRAAFDLLLERGASVDGANGGYIHRDLVRWLVERGADVNARAGDQARQTPLHSAAWNGDLAMAMLLVELGADVHARDRQYDGTPLGWAETAREITNNPACDDVAAFLRDLS